MAPDEPTADQQENSKRPWLEPHRFKPGQSGNPSGRPKGRVSLKTELQKLLNENGGDIAAALAQVGIEKARGGNFKFWEAILKLADVPDDEATDEQRPDTPVDGVAFPRGAIPTVPLEEEVCDSPSGQTERQDREREAETGGGSD